MSICYVNYNTENKTGTMAETAFGSGLLSAEVYHLLLQESAA